MFLSCTIAGVWMLQLLRDNQPPQDIGCLASKGSCEEMQRKIQYRSRPNYRCVQAPKVPG